MAKSSKNEINKKVVLVTGASKPKGIGLAIAVNLCEQGHKVYATYRRPAIGPKLKEWAEKHHFPIEFIYLDLSDEDSIQEAVHQITKKEGRIDILINNAAYGVIGAIEAQTQKQMMEQMQVNFFGPMLLCQEVLPSMRKQKSGLIINISGVQGISGFPYTGFCCASKAALESASEALALELFPWNIHVVVVQPGNVSTRQSIGKGSRLEEATSPYQKPHEVLMRQYEEKEKDPKNIPHSQTPQQIASFIHVIIEDKKPKLRYQTNASVAALASLKLRDLDGSIMAKELRKSIDSIGS